MDNTQVALRPEQTYRPFITAEDKSALPQNGQAYTFLDGNYMPCTSMDDAVFAWYSICLPPPSGFVLCNQGFSPYGEPLPTIEDFSASEILDMSQTLSFLPNTQPVLRALPEKTENTTTVSGSPKIALVSGSGRVISSSDEETEPSYQLLVGADGYYLKIPKKETAQRITNFIISLRQIRHYISQGNDNGEDRRKIFLEVKLFERTEPPTG